MKSTKKTATKKAPLSEKAINAQVLQIIAFMQTAPPIIQSGLSSFFTDAMNETDTTILRNGEEIDRKGLADFLRIAHAKGLDHDSGGFYAEGQEHARHLLPRARAAAIINDAETYDQDTSNYTDYILEYEPENLVAWVKRVEGGERYVYPRWPLVGTPEPERGTRDWRAWKIQHLCAAIESREFGEGKPGSIAADEVATIFDRARLGHIVVSDRMQRLLPTLLEVIDEAEEASNQPHTLEAEDNDETSLRQVSQNVPRADLIFETATWEDTRRIVHRDSLMRMEWGEEAIGDLLTLMACLTYCNPSDRDLAFHEVVNAFLPTLYVAQNAAELMCIKRFQSKETGKW